MRVTDVYIRLVKVNQDNKLLAFASVTFDGVFILHDIKVIDSLRGPFLGMPNRRMQDRCEMCGEKNFLLYHYCSYCGVKLDQDRAFKDTNGLYVPGLGKRNQLYQDICHPMGHWFRKYLTEEVLAAYYRELNRPVSDMEDLEILTSNNSDMEVD